MKRHHAADPAHRAIRNGAGAAELLFGVYKLVNRRHPCVLARIPRSRLAWWSFLMATVHGAGLMPVPFMRGPCAAPTSGTPGHAAVPHFLAGTNMGTALLVATVHTLASLAAGIGIAWAVYRCLGLRFLRRA